MQQYKQAFIEFLIQAGALKFGEFTLKSGRQAPYFINMGSFSTGEELYALGKFYAAAYLDAGVSCDVIFGPAYKGIPLAVATSAVLFREYGKQVAYAFNRKETKEYGMKDRIIGAPLTATTRVFLIDDVITAGTAIREGVQLLAENGNPKIVGVLIAVDRMEKNNEGANAVAAVKESLGIPVFSIVTIDDVVAALYQRPVNGTVYIDDAKMATITAYRKSYGI